MTATRICVIEPLESRRLLSVASAPWNPAEPTADASMISSAPLVHAAISGSAADLTAAVTASPLTAGARKYSFTVTYTDPALVRRKSLGSGDVLVTGPNGFSAKAKLVSVDSRQNAA